MLFFSEPSWVLKSPLQAEETGSKSLPQRHPGGWHHQLSRGWAMKAQKQFCSEV